MADPWRTALPLALLLWTAALGWLVAGWLSIAAGLVFMLWVSLLVDETEHSPSRRRS